jgi:vacuolar-type H+-ATPase subunit I/STV1
MKIVDELPDWFRDPETFWQKVSVGMGVVSLILLGITLEFRAEKVACEKQIQELTSLNDRQRKTIAQIGGELAQVKSSMSSIASRMDELLTASREQTELASALLSEATDDSEELQTTANESQPLQQADAGTSASNVGEMSHTLVADFNHDGIVDWADFDLFSKSWGQDGKLPVDLDHDREVTWKDFQIFAGEWMKTEPWYKGKGNG